MKIIFLDIDGVLNNAKTHDKDPDEHIQWPGWGFLGIDRSNMVILNKLLAIDISIVISSTWRIFNSLEVLRERLYGAGLNRLAPIIGATPSSLSGIERKEEIRDWLRRLDRASDPSFVILDDDSDAEIPGHFVRVNNTVGLTHANVAAAKEILQRSRV